MQMACEGKANQVDEDLLIIYHQTSCTLVNCYQNHNNYESVLAALNIADCGGKERM